MKEGLGHNSVVQHLPNMCKALGLILAVTTITLWGVGGRVWV